MDIYYRYPKGLQYTPLDTLPSQSESENDREKPSRIKPTEYHFSFGTSACGPMTFIFKQQSRLTNSSPTHRLSPTRECEQTANRPTISPLIRVQFRLPVRLVRSLRDRHHRHNRSKQYYHLLFPQSSRNHVVPMSYRQA